MPDAALIIDIIAWLVGAGIIALFSWNFFNAGDYFFDTPSSQQQNQDRLVFSEPLLPIFATSRWRYRKWFGVFLLCTTLVYVLVAFGLDQPLDTASDKEENLEWYRAYNQIFAALLVSGLVNILPTQLQFLDLLRLLRNVTHRRAKIPEEALSIFRNIMNFELNISDDQKQSAIDCIGKDYLGKSDFKAAENPIDQNTIEKNWSKTCHLLTSINNLASEANSPYATNLNRKELVYEQAKHNFEIIKGDIKRYRANPGSVSIDSLKERTRLLLKQFSKLTVCLVFISELKEEDIYRKLGSLGINLRKRLSYNLNISFLAGSTLIFAMLSFASIYLLAITADVGNKLGSAQALQISLAAVLIVCMPIMVTFFIKYMSPSIWPVRGQFSKRQPTPPIVMLFLGISLGVVGFYIMSFTGLFEKRAWHEFLPYTSISGLIGMLAAIAIDSRPRVWQNNYALFRAIKWGIAATACFVVLTIFSIFIINDVQLQGEQMKQALAKRPFTLGLTACIGLLSGVLISLLSEYSTRIKTSKDELYLNLSEYLLPRLGYENVSHLNSDALNKRLNEIRERLPNAFIGYLQKNAFMNEDGKMSSDSVSQLKSDMSMSHAA